MNRRTLIIIASIIVILGLLIAIYFVFFASSGSKLTGTSGAPFGGSGSTVVNDGTTLAPGVAQQGAGTIVAPHLIEITPGPVARGSVALFIPAPTSTTTVDTASTTVTTNIAPPSFDDTEVRYVDRASGNLYAFRVIARTLTRLSNHTLPGIQEATWLSDGSVAFVRFLEKDQNGASDHIDTYALPSNGTGGYLLDQDLDQFISNGSSSIVTLASNSDGSTATIAQPDGSSPRTIFSTPLTSITAAYAGQDLVVTTKPSDSLPGYAFLVNHTTGDFTDMLGPLDGLTTLPSPSGKLLLYSYSDHGKLSTQVLDMTTGTTVALPLSTPTEKCAWSSSNTQIYCAVPTSLIGSLDDWYQGAFSYTDRVWSIDLNTRTATLLFDPYQLAKEEIDAVSLTLDPQEKVLVFMNKRDGSLWAYTF